MVPFTGMAEVETWPTPVIVIPEPVSRAVSVPADTVTVGTAAAEKGLVRTMGDPLQASNAWSMGNLGLSTALRDEPDYSSGDDADVEFAPPRASWRERVRGRLVRWALTAGVVAAFVNHWPGGHH